MGHDVLERCQHVFLGLGAVGRDFPPCDEQIERERELVHGHVAVFAEGRIARRAGRLCNSRRELLGDLTPRHARPSVLDFDIRVQNLTGAWIGAAGADRERSRLVAHDPADRGMAGIRGAELRIVGLHLHLNRVLEAESFECLVPLENAGLDRFAIFFRDIAIKPVDDGDLWLGHLGVGILFLEPPAFYIIDFRERV